MSNKVLAVLVDLSGTLHVGDAATSGAVEALKRLRQSDLKVRFVTNTTKESGADLNKRLIKCGFDIEPEEIWSSLSAGRAVVQQRQLRPLLLLQPSARDQFQGMDQQDPNVVLVGLAPDVLDYANMNKAFRLLLSGAPLLALHAGRYYKEEDGLSIGPGAFVKALEYSAGVTAEVIGKPEKSFFQAALTSLGCTAQQAVMIGDDVRDDVAGAQSTGMTGVLVQTGKYRPGDEATIVPPPTRTVPCFAAAVDWILDTYAS